MHGEADTIIAHSHAAIFPSAIRKIFRGGKLIYLCHEPPRFLYDLRFLTLSRRGPVGRVVLRVGAPILRLIDSWAVTKADASFVLSRYSAKQFEDIYGKKPIIEPPGVDLEQFRPLAKTDFHPGPLITVGKLHPRKNLSLLLAALSLEQLSNIRLIVVGTGPQETELKSLATDIGNNDRIDWLGSVNDQELQSAYNKASVFVFCAHDEPFGLVVLEAMSIGLPVVVPNEGGPQEIVGNGKYGWVYRQDNVNSLSTAIKQATAATKEELTAAQAHAQSYSWKRYTKAIAKKAML